MLSILSILILWNSHFKMDIDWTPWLDVSIHRRLEVLCIGCFMFCGLFGGIISIGILFYLVVISNLSIKYWVVHSEKAIQIILETNLIKTISKWITMNAYVTQHFKNWLRVNFRLIFISKNVKKKNLKRTNNRQTKKQYSNFLHETIALNLNKLARMHHFIYHS